MKTNIALFGGGNHISYCLDIIQKEDKYNVVGVIDSILPIGQWIYGYRVIGRQEDVKQLGEKYNFSSGLITVGDNWIRHKIYQDIKKSDPKFIFVNAIHPSVIKGYNVYLGQGVIAMAGVILNPHAYVDDFAFFATGAQIEHHCKIDKFASVSAGSVLGGHVHIKEFAAVTLGVTVVDRVTIGRNSVVGSGSLVTKDVDDNVLVYGSPAKLIRPRQEGERFLK